MDIEALRRLAEQGDAKAQYQLATSLEKGENTPQNKEEAL
jgi:TPR repeat protein